MMTMKMRETVLAGLLCVVTFTYAERPTLIRHFTFDDGFSESVYRNEPVEIVGNPGTVEGVSGEAVHLDGQSALVYDDYFDLNVEQFTFTAWVRLDEQEGLYAVVNKGVDAYWIFVNHGEVKGGFYDKKFYEAISGTYLQPGKWYFTAITYDGEMLRLFVDQHLHWIKKIEGKPRSVDGPLVIGAEPNQPHSYFFRGAIDEVRLYDGAISKAEMLKLYQEHR
ncbi:MAG: LamG domain-containing protein [Verrucomicrobiota bacterium]